MSSEYFPTEKPDSSPKEHDYHADSSDEHISDRSDITGSFIQIGGAQLAENLDRIAAEGPDTIQSYLADLLADTEGNAPAAERAAAFTLLAEQQRTRNNEKNVLAGEALVHAATDSVQNSQKGIGIHAQKIRVGIATFAQSFARRQDDSRHAANHVATGLGELNEHRRSWVEDQESFHSEYETTRQAINDNDADLHRAQLSLAPDYDGSPVDLLDMIDNNIPTLVANRIHQDVTAGKPISETISSLLTNQPDEQMSQRVGLYDAFAQQQLDIIKRVLNDTAGLGLDHEREALELYAKFSNPSKINNLALLIKNVEELPLKLRSAFGTITGISDGLYRQLGLLDNPRRTEPEQSPSKEPEKYMPDPSREEPTEPQSRSTPTPDLRQPYYGAAKGMKEYIGTIPIDSADTVELPIQQPPKQPQPEIRPEEPYIRPPKHKAGDVYTGKEDASTRYTAPSSIADQPTIPINRPRIARATDMPPPRISRKFAQNRLDGPNASVAPSVDTRPKWLRSVDKANGRD